MRAHTRNHSIICLMIIISLLLSGMYFDTVTPDDFFAYSSFSIMSIDDPSFDFYYKDTKVCTTEMLNECACVQQQPEELSVFLHLLFTDQLALIQRRALQNPETIRAFCRTLDALVTEYMHQSDGKKRI